jgi:hypothetical protein
MSTAAECESEIRAMISRAIQQKRPHVEINAGELRRPLGGYPGHSHSMPSCCAAMRAKLEEFGGEIIHRTDSGDGASFTVRYDATVMPS